MNSTGSSGFILSRQSDELFKQNEFGRGDRQFRKLSASHPQQRSEAFGKPLLDSMLRQVPHSSVLEPKHSKRVGRRKGQGEAERERE